MRSAEQKKAAENWDPVAPNRLQKKMQTLVLFLFQRNSTTQIVYLTSAEKKFSAELSIQTYGSAELIFWFFVVDFCWFNAFP